MDSPTPTLGQDALYHVLHHILSLPEDGPVDIALVTLDCKTISDFLHFSTDDIALLQYPKQTATIIDGEDVCSILDTPLPTLAKLKLCKFRKWAYHLGYLQDQDWFTLSTQDYNEFVQTGSTSRPPSIATTQSPPIDVDDKTFSHIKQEINPKIGIEDQTISHLKKDISNPQFDDLQSNGEYVPDSHHKTKLETIQEEDLYLQFDDLQPNGEHVPDSHHKTQLEIIQEEDLYVQFDDLQPNGELVPDFHHEAHAIHVMSDDK